MSVGMQQITDFFLQQQLLQLAIPTPFIRMSDAKTRTDENFACPSIGTARPDSQIANKKISADFVALMIIAIAT